MRDPGQSSSVRSDHPAFNGDLFSITYVQSVLESECMHLARTRTVAVETRGFLFSLVTRRGVISVAIGGCLCE